MLLDGDDDNDDHDDDAADDDDGCYLHCNSCDSECR